MNIVLIEDLRAPILTEELKKSTPKSSIIKIEPKNTITSLALMKSRPTLTQSWLVFIDEKVSDSVIESCVKVPNCVNIIYSKSTDAERKLAICRLGGESKILNMVNLNKDDCIKHIQKRIGTSESIAKVIAGRCNYFLPHVEESLLVLESLGRSITKSDVELYIQQRTNITVHSLFYHLVRYKKLDDKVISDFLYQYRFAFSYIKNKLLMLFSESEKIYKSIESGDLGSDNVKDYVKSNKVKISEYMIETLINKIHPVIGLGDLVLIRITVEKVDDMINLLSLF